MHEMMACEPDQFENNEYCFQKMALINRLKIPMNGEDQVSLITGAIQDEHLKLGGRMAVGYSAPRSRSRR
jgi:hypothetical protein